MSDYKNTPEYKTLADGTISDVELRLMLRNATQFDTPADNVTMALAFAQSHRCPIHLSLKGDGWICEVEHYMSFGKYQVYDIYPARAISRALLMWMIEGDGVEVVRER